MHRLALRFKILSQNTVSRILGRVYASSPVSSGLTGSLAEAHTKDIAKLTRAARKTRAKGGRMLTLHDVGPRSDLDARSRELAGLVRGRAGRWTYKCLRSCRTRVYAYSSFS